MPSEPSFDASDLQGLVRLLTDATLKTTDLVEEVHREVLHPPFLPATPVQSLLTRLSGFVYQRVRQTAFWAGRGGEKALSWLPAGTGLTFSAKADLLAIANGVIGDHLAATRNPLALPMELRWGEATFLPRRETAPPPTPPARGKIILMVHGLCMHDRQWLREGHDHGALLAEKLGASPLYLHYNTGLHIATNGKRLDQLLEELLAVWPVPVTEITVLAHSMGGMVSRAALYCGQQAGHRWPALLNKLVFLGTPHHGAPLERLGNYVDHLLGALPYTKPFARLGKLRSAGITDLRFGYLREADWQGADRFERPSQSPSLLPLPAAVGCYAVAATWHQAATHTLGDGLVPLSSALGQHQEPARTLAFPSSHTLVVPQTHHFDLLNHPEVFAQLETWLS